jgi:hypothetical protein
VSRRLEKSTSVPGAAKAGVEQSSRPRAPRDCRALRDSAVSSEPSLSLMRPSPGANGSAQFRFGHSQPRLGVVCSPSISPSSAQTYARVKTGSAPVRLPRYDTGAHRTAEDRAGQASKFPILLHILLQRATQPSPSSQRCRLFLSRRFAGRVCPVIRQPPSAIRRSSV